MNVWNRISPFLLLSLLMLSPIMLPGCSDDPASGPVDTDGIPELSFKLFVDVGSDAVPEWELRWMGDANGPAADSPEQTPGPMAGFLGRFKIEWAATSSNGPIQGYRYRAEQGGGEFVPADIEGQKQWDPDATSFVFGNDEAPSADLGVDCDADANHCDPARVRFPSGAYVLAVEALDTSDVESDPTGGELHFRVNYSPETSLVDDAEYPRFVVKDAAGVVLTEGQFASGDTIPANSTVLFKSVGYDKFENELPPGVPVDSLCCDVPLDYDPDLPPDHPDFVPLVEYQSRLVTVRRVGESDDVRETSNLFSAPSALDTMSFWVGPLDFTYESRTVDEHGLRDPMPEEFDLIGGFRPEVIESLTIPGGDIVGDPGDVADTLLFRVLPGLPPFPDNEIPFAGPIANIVRWFVEDPTADCGGVLLTPGAMDPPEGTVAVSGVVVQVSLNFVGMEDSRDPMSPVKAWTFAIFSDKDPDNEIEDGLESRDLSFYTNSPLPNEWEFGRGETIDIWAPLELAFNPDLYGPSSTDENKRAIGCLVAKQLGNMTVRLRGRTTRNEDQYRLYSETRKGPDPYALSLPIGEFGRQSATVEVSCRFLIGIGTGATPDSYWPDF